MIFLEYLEELFSSLSKECCLDLNSFLVNKIHVQKNTLASLVSPFSLLTFLGNSCSYFPVSTELVQAPDGCIHFLKRTQSFPSTIGIAVEVGTVSSF